MFLKYFLLSGPLLPYNNGCNYKIMSPKGSNVLRVVNAKQKAGVCKAWLMHMGGS